MGRVARTFQVLSILALGSLSALAMSTCAQAQSALPQPTPPFKGKIGKTFKDSVPDFPQPIRAPKGAPNVVVILLDDVGFGQPGTFGGPIPTPNLDKLTHEGISYNRFHTTAICSPTRAAVLIPNLTERDSVALPESARI